MFYLFSILGVNEGQNTVLRTEKKKIPGSGPWAGLLGLALEEVFITDIRGTISPTPDPPHRRESYDPSSLGTSVFVYHQTLDHGMGKRTGDWFDSRQ